MMKFFKLFFLSFLIVSCGVPQEDYQALQQQNSDLKNQVEILKKELNDLKYGASTIFKKAKTKIAEEDYDKARELLTQINHDYPNSDESLQTISLLKIVNEKIEDKQFEKAKSSKDVTQIKTYLNAYPSGKYAQEANQILIHLTVENAFESIYSKELSDFNEDYLKNLYYQDTISVVKLKNSTGSSLTFWIDGLESKRLEIDGNQEQEVKLRNGSYRIAAETNSGNFFINTQELSGYYQASYISNKTTYRENDYPNYPSNSFPSNQSSNSYRSEYSTPNYNNVSPNYKRRVGAVCRDGWRSSATGRGACSHHGGVAYWLYE